MCVLESLRADLEAEKRRREDLEVQLLALEVELADLHTLVIEYIVQERATLISRVRWAEKNDVVKNRLPKDRQPVKVAIVP